MTQLFTYNQEQAAQVGASQYVSKSGGYDVKVTRAIATKSQTQGSQAQFLELDLETREGQKCNYVKICFMKADGSQLDFGNQLIQSVMGCAGVQYLTVDQNGNCNELLNKQFKAVLQRVDFSKSDGTDGYKFDLKLPALMTGQTIQEQLASKQAQAFASYAGTIEDKDERKTNSQATSQQPPKMAPAYNQQPAQTQSYGTPPPGYDQQPQQGSDQQENFDDIPF